MLTRNSLKKYLGTANTYSGALSLVIAVLSFLVAYMQAMKFTHGQVEVANLIIQEVGIIPMWTGALLLIVGSIFQTLFLLLLFKTRGDIAGNYGWPLSIAAYILMWTILPLFFFVTIIIAIIFTLLLKWYAKKASPEQTRTASIHFFGTVLVSLLFLGIWYFPLVPHSTVTLSDDTVRSVKILSENDGNLLIVDNESRKIEKLMSSDVKNQKLCFPEKAWFLYTLNDVVAPQYRVLESCPE